MLYVPREKGMWDTWIFFHEGVFHLFYLQSLQGKTWPQIGHVTSKDLLHWTEQQPALKCGEAGDWDKRPLGTGMVFAHEGKFYMSYCSLDRGKPQRIGLAYSDDLFCWSKLFHKPILEPAGGGEFYETYGAKALRDSISWRDAFIFFDEKENLFHALFTARTANGPYSRRGCIAHATSRNLADWKILPPFYAPGQFFDYEVPSLHKIGEKYYLLWSSMRIYNNHYSTALRSMASGTFYAWSSEPYAGFNLPPQDNLLVGSGNSRWDNYVGRLLPVQDETLLLYQMIGAEEIDLVSLSAPKVVRQEGNGRLVAGYCKRCDALKKRKLVSRIKKDWIRPQNFVEGEKWQIEADTLYAEVRGSFILPTDETADNFMLEVEVMLKEGFFAGLGMKGKGNPRNAISAGTVLDGRTSAVHVIKKSSGLPGPLLVPTDSSGFSFTPRRFHHLRILVRRPWTDIFWDDQLYFSLALPWPEGGVLVFIACDAKARFRNLMVHELY